MSTHRTATVKETVPGTWLVGDEADNATVHLYPTDQWRCGDHGVLSETFFCPHVLALRGHQQVTTCQYPSETCMDIACGSRRVDGTPSTIALCPRHWQLVEKMP